MLRYQNSDIIEVGVDECARGVLFGRIYSAAVIYPNNGIPKEIEDIITKLDISKSVGPNSIPNQLIKLIKKSG